MNAPAAAHAVVCVGLSNKRRYIQCKLTRNKQHIASKALNNWQGLNTLQPTTEVKINKLSKIEIN